MRVENRKIYVYWGGTEVYVGRAIGWKCEGVLKLRMPREHEQACTAFAEYFGCLVLPVGLYVWPEHRLPMSFTFPKGNGGMKEVQTIDYVGQIG